MGTPTLFVDAIDRIEKEFQPLILDLLEAIERNPALENWKVVVSLRNTGAEVLQIWLGDFLSRNKSDSLEVGHLTDEEAREIADARPHLDSLLFGNSEVKEVTRRPFFAKILDQGFNADPGNKILVPKSELDLIRNWWARGGFNEGGEKALKRQRSLIELAIARSRDLSGPIKIGNLSSLDELQELRSDGIIQDVYSGVSVSFSHDIFFEWSFLFTLLDAKDDYVAHIKDCGEPPAVGRAVELLSQLEYEESSKWAASLRLFEDDRLRSQWLRAWLFGPFNSPSFETSSVRLLAEFSRDESKLFRRLLVWFQAEKTTPNNRVLSLDLPLSERQVLAYSWSWPSDFKVWRRMLKFVHVHIASIPVRFYPVVIDVFEVWQNAVSKFRNEISRRFLEEFVIWLAEIDSDSSDRSFLRNESRWKELSNLEDFRKKIITLLANASIAEPDLIEGYLSKKIGFGKISSSTAAHIFRQSHFLAQSMPKLLVEVALAFLKKPFPEETRARLKKERSSVGIPPYYSSFDLNRLSIEDDHSSFYPESPLREPFHSLFEFSPQEGIRLVRELCNHAMEAWQQLHRLSHDSDGTPIPLKLDFPWGEEMFWGTSREYRFFRGVFGPNAISCGLMAMEEWAFKQIESGYDLDELIRQIVSENRCAAVLGIAGMLAMEKQTVSWTTLPLFTSQRLFEMDLHRRMEDSSIPPNLTGFVNELDRSHYEAVKKGNERPVRRRDMRAQIPKFVVGQKEINQKARDIISSFAENLPFEYEEHRNIPAAQEKLREDALRYAELADLATYKAYRVSEESDEVMIVHESPSAAKPENVAEAEKATQRIAESNLWSWASKSFETGSISDTYTLEAALELAKAAISRGIFEPVSCEATEGLLGMRRGGVVAVAAMVLHFRKDIDNEELTWARGIIEVGLTLPEERLHFWSPSSIISYHPCISVARAISSEIKNKTASKTSHYDLLSLVAHPLECVSIAALGEAIRLWSDDSFFTWAALEVALDLCHVHPSEDGQMRTHHSPLHTQERALKAIEVAFSNWQMKNWCSLPLPPQAWEKGGLKRSPSHRPRYFDSDEDESEWGEPEVAWNKEKGENILKLIPLSEVLESDAKPFLIDFLSGLLDWTIEKNTPPWKSEYDGDRPSSDLIKWNYTLGHRLGVLAGLVPLDLFKERFLGPVCGLRDGICWSILGSITDSHICSYIYDPKEVLADSVDMLSACLERFLEASEFNSESYSGNEFTGFDDSRLVRDLMFISVEDASLSSRFANGDWSELALILPLVDRLIRSGAHLSSVVGAYITLCERSKEFYPAEDFSSQILAVLNSDKDGGRKLVKKLLPARIAELVQYFSHRETPMTSDLARDFLRILDKLVDLGDRRAAALQVQESFREVRLV
ncbi:hypothetical protein AAFN60_09020 [Roseibacillus persicicus]|uniref:ATP-binding protein n=1 Tax=Roseibacillus persicicus TaxID=454148 RepID=UPI00398A5F10